MSPVIEPTRPSTVVFAWLRLHGADDEHSVPDPLGATYSVVCTAALASAAPKKAAEMGDEANPSTDSQGAGGARADCFLIGRALSRPWRFRCNVPDRRWSSPKYENALSSD